MLKITPEIAVSDDEIVLQFVRSSGPGGQHVNKVATAVQLRFDVAGSPSLPDEVRTRLRSIAGRRLTEGGILVIDARRFRSQERNRQDAIERLVTLIRRAAQRPKPRKKTRPSAGARQRRLEEKRRRGETKLLRRRVTDE